MHTEHHHLCTLLFWIAATTTMTTSSFQSSWAKRQGMIDNWTVSLTTEHTEWTRRGDLAGVVVVAGWVDKGGGNWVGGGLWFRMWVTHVWFWFFQSQSPFNLVPSVVVSWVLDSLACATTLLGIKSQKQEQHSVALARKEAENGESDAYTVSMETSEHYSVTSGPRRLQTRARRAWVAYLTNSLSGRRSREWISDLAGNEEPGWWGGLIP